MESECSGVELVKALLRENLVKLIIVIFIAINSSEVHWDLF